MARRHGERAVSGRKVLLPTWPRPRGQAGHRHTVPHHQQLSLTHGPALGVAPQTADGAAGSSLPSDPSPVMTPSPSSLSPTGSRPTAASLWAPPASPPWRHASLAWRRSRRVAASAVRLPRPQSTSPCWAGKGRHPWRQLAGGLRGKLSEARPVPAPKPGAPGTRVARAGSAARRRKVPVKGARPARRR